MTAHCKSRHTTWPSGHNTFTYLLRRRQPSRSPPSPLLMSSVVFCPGLSSTTRRWETVDIVPSASPCCSYPFWCFGGRSSTLRSLSSPVLPYTAPALASLWLNAATYCVIWWVSSGFPALLEWWSLHKELASSLALCWRVSSLSRFRQMAALFVLASCIRVGINVLPMLPQGQPDPGVRQTRWLALKPTTN